MIASTSSLVTIESSNLDWLMAPGCQDECVHSRERDCPVLIFQHPYADRIPELSPDEVVLPEPPFLLHSEELLPPEHRLVVGDDGPMNPVQLHVIERQLVQELHRFDGGGDASYCLGLADEEASWF